MAKLNSETIAKIIQGDVGLIKLLPGNEQETVNKCYEEAGSPEVTKNSLISVLTDLKNKRISEEDAQKWASFILRGHLLCTNSKRVIAANVGIDPNIEEELVEIIVRLDELGDLIDGEMTDQEINKHLADLKKL